MDHRFRLSRHVVFEPLVNRWHATATTVSPLPGLLDVTGHQIPALESYLEAPSSHFEGARRIPGSAFLAIPPQRAAEVASLLDRTAQRFSAEAILIDELRAFESWLLSSATGEELSAAYERVPPPLRPFVELVYDYHARPHARFEEGLLYRSPLYPRDVHSTSAFILESDADRTFSASTPRLPSLDLAELGTVWEAPEWSRVFDLDLHPAPRDQALERLAAVGLGAPRAEKVLEPFTPSDPPPTGDVQVMGHATVLFRHRGETILFDPVISPIPRRGGAPRTTFADLPERIDVVAITHAHNDHFALETLWRLRDRVGTLVVPRNMGLAWADVSLRRVAERMGYRRIVEVSAGDSLLLADGELVAGPFWGEHGDVAHGNRCTYALRLGKRVMLMLVDAQPLAPESFSEFARQLGAEIHSLWLNTELVGAPLGWTFDAVFPKKRDKKKEITRRCRGSNKKEALDLVERLRPRCVFNYAMGTEPWLSFILGGEDRESSIAREEESRAMLEAARARGLEARRLVAGEIFPLT